MTSSRPITQLTRQHPVPGASHHQHKSEWRPNPPHETNQAHLYAQGLILWEVQIPRDFSTLDTGGQCLVNIPGSF
jgi:hypothetical protein